MKNTLPTLIIGAGPVGLAAAAQLELRNEAYVVVEAGSQVGASIRKWAHVPVFSPWRYMVDEAAQALLAQTGWVAPDGESYPTGGEFVQRYLEPLGALPAIHKNLRLNTRVTHVVRDGYDKLKSRTGKGKREDAPLMVTIEAQNADGIISEGQILAKAVIDASGTYETPNPLGASGVPALGERAHANRIFYGIPSVLANDRVRYANKRVMVVGSGHSAFNVILELVKLTQSAPDTHIEWAIRRSDFGQMFGGLSDDQLAARGELGANAKRLIDNGTVKMHTGFKIAQLAQAGEQVRVMSDDGREVLVDEIVACTGFRPNLEMLRELRLDLDDRNEAPRALAGAIDPNLHSCGSVPPHGYNELKHEAEPGFYVVGMKSYGRAPTFLMLTGYEQVRSITAAIAGDMKAALDVRLVLPETGVCNAGLGGGGACCAVDPAIGATAEQTSDCGCNTGCCAEPAAPSKTSKLISIDSLFR
ncbi:MAG: NAD(P)-binding domain-containing protein [Anaerolineae bacterium]|nr:NAD(P)-binding domain-containing protein [Anaerolineae bacterium]